VDRIFRQLLIPGKKGINIRAIQQLRLSIGIAQFELRNEAQSVPLVGQEGADADSEVQRRASEDRSSPDDSAIKALRENIEESLGRVDELERQSASLVQDLQTPNMKDETPEQSAADKKREEVSIAEHLKQTSSVEKQTASARIGLANLRKQLASLRQRVRHRKAARDELAKLAVSLEEQTARSDKAEAARLMAVQVLVREASGAFWKLRREVAQKLHANCQSSGKSISDLFQAISRDDCKTVRAFDVALFCRDRSIQCGVSHIKLLLASSERGLLLAEASAQSAIAVDDRKVGKDEFNQLCRLFYKVDRAMPLTSNLVLHGGQELRKLAPGEIVELQQGPTAEGVTGVTRICVRALKDNSYGWVSISETAGGESFVSPTPGVMRVLRRRLLGSVPGEAALLARPGRCLHEGEHVEILDWQRGDGETQLRVRAHGDGAVGWLNSLDDRGQPTLQAV